MSYTIRIAKPEDRENLIRFFLEMMQLLQPFGHDIKATQKNAEFFTDTIFLPAAGRGEPVLIVRDSKTGKDVGAIFWCEAPQMLADSEPTGMGYGTYVCPEFQRQGLGKAMRKLAASMFRAKGIKRVVGSALTGHTAGHASLLAMGMKATSTIYELRL